MNTHETNDTPPSRDDVAQTALKRVSDLEFNYNVIKQQLAAERAESDRLRKNIGCARNQGTTQFCHEAVDAKAEAERLRAELAIERNKAIGNALAAESRDILAAENAKLRAVVAELEQAKS